MLDLACIFTTGGVILFCKTFCDLDLAVVNDFIFNVFVQEKLGERELKVRDRIYIWKFDNEINLVFLFVYQELFKAFDFMEMLNYTKSYYKKKCFSLVQKRGDLIINSPEFEAEFDKIYRGFIKKNAQQDFSTKPNMRIDSANIAREPEDKDEASPSEPKDKDQGEPKEVEQTVIEKNETKPHSILKNRENSSPEKQEKPVEKQKSVGFVEDIKAQESKAARDPLKKLTPREAMEEKIRQQQLKKQAKAKPQDDKTVENSRSDHKSLYSDKVSKKLMDQLDRSKKINSKAADGPQKNDSYFGKDEDLDLDFGIISDDEKRDSTQKQKKSGILSNLKSSFKSLTEGKVLTEKDVRVVLEKFKEDLMKKNVAEEIAREITENLNVKLLNQKVQVFSSITDLARTTLKESLTKILTPKKTHDILSEAMKAREKGETYVVAFIGVNGVGKSTNLAKVAYLFKSQGFSVMFAACDNFRAGAVEQLKQHGVNLDIPVYDRGYKDEPHRIAKEAIKEAKSKRIDVVLIDTAGRMQNNEPLMRALATLVSVNNPNMVCFIGEALVGNDGVDQLTNFNEALIKYSTEENSKREIDAILISKFDTVDEKGKVSLTQSALPSR